MIVKILGLQYVNRKLEDGRTTEGVQLRYGFPDPDVCGLEVASDWISAGTGVLADFKPYLNGRLNELLGKKAELEQIPKKKRDGSYYLKTASIKLLNDEK